MNNKESARHLRALAAAVTLVTALSAASVYGKDAADVAVDPLSPDAGDFLDVDIVESLRQAEAAYRAGEVEEAARIYLTYLRSDIHDGRAIYNLACCYALLGRAELAAECLRRAHAAGFTDVEFAAKDADFDNVRGVEPFASAFAEFKAAEEIGGDARTLYIQAPVILPCYVFLPEGYDAAEPRTLVVGLHGVAGNAANFAKLRKKFAGPEFIFAVPEAPYALPLRRSVGYGWRADTPALESVMRESYVASSRYVVELVDGLRGRYNVGDVYLLGFSQGAWLAYGAAIRNPAVFKGFICCSGPFRTAELTAAELDAGAGLRVFISQGEGDGDVAYAEAEAAYEALETFGYDVTFRGFDGGHEIPAGIAAEIGKWIAE
jgi:phospholipase/carboxylesterase